LFWKHGVDYGNVEDLRRSRLVQHQNDHYRLWSLGAGLALPMAIGVLRGDVLGAFLFGVVAREFVVLNSAFLTNSAAHTFGGRPYDRTVSATDNAVVALLTNGEGYHNFHHCFPADYRHGVASYSWDPTKWLIWTLSVAHLASDLKRTSRESVLERRALAAFAA